MSTTQRRRVLRTRRSRPRSGEGVVRLSRSGATTDSVVTDDHASAQIVPAEDAPVAAEMDVAPDEAPASTCEPSSKA